MANWTVPGYTHVKELGSGGFGDVVLATHNATGVRVAIKYLRRGLLADPGFAEMFRGEAAVLASLNDPNIVRLYEYVEASAGAAIVMELIEGVSLCDIIDHLGKTSPEAALVVLHGSLIGLAAAHQRGVVHRDYKPANVLVDETGASKLTDFGIAVRVGDTTTPAGSLHYVAPEQMTGAAASPASDIYSATATFFECITGRPPFTGELLVELVYKHLHAPVPLDQVPEPLRPIVAAGMAKDPRNRPADIGAFITQLRAIATGAFGPEWEERGRSKLGEAALLLAALWPSGEPPATAGAAVRQVPLHRRLGSVRIAMLVGVATLLVAVGAVLAAGTQRGQHNLGFHHPRLAVPLSPQPTIKTTPSPSASSSATGPTTGPPTSPPGHSSSSPSAVSVPDVVGESSSAATAAMTAAHLKVSYAPVDSTASKDVVVSTDPAAGTSVAADSTVVLSISLADEGTVPDVVGLTSDAMRSALATAGFTDISTTYTATSSLRLDNTVVDQSVAPGTIALYTTPITVTIAILQQVPK